MSSFVPNPRQADLLAAVRTLGSMTVEALADQFGVTLQTVRRDVKLLSDVGLLARFHGGVRVPASTTENIAYRQRQQLNEPAKQRIAKAVAKAVPRARLCLAEFARLMGDQPFMAGERISLADLMVAPLLYYLARVPEGEVPIAEHPSLRAWLRRIEDRQSFQVTKPPGL